MRAVQLAEFGVENIELRDVADAEVAAGEVLIATEAATINPADYGMVTGGMASFLPPIIVSPYTYGGPDAVALRALADMASSGKLHTPVARAFPAADARAAYEEFAAGSRRGRIVLTFSGDQAPPRRLT